MGNLVANKNKKHVMWASLCSLLLGLAVFLVIAPLPMAAQSTDDGDTAGEQTEQLSGQNQAEIDTGEEAELDDLNTEIDARREKIEELKKKADVYEKNVKSKQQEAVTLESQMSIIDLRVSQTENDITRVREEIEKVSLEIDGLQLKIADKEVELEQTKKILAEYLKLIYKYDQKTYLEIFMVNESFSEFFDQMKYTEDLQGNVEKALSELQQVKQGLENEKTEQENKHAELSELTDKLQISIASLGDQKVYKENLLEQTKESEEKFAAMLQEAKREQQAVEAEIYSLETKARQQLQEEGIELDTSTALMWPVSPTKGISAYFHDPTYPYRWLFEHPAIDIPQPQGTPIRAADNGYIVRAKNAGLGYSYIMIVHNDEISTVYGHTSRIDVAEDDYVVRGQQIGLIGGTPGTPGAGRLTTGPHLHFEVRSNGIPVNPLDYLPSL